MRFNEKNTLDDDDLDHSGSLVHGNRPKKALPKRRKGTRVALFSLIAILVVAAAVFFALQYKEAQDDVRRLSNPQEAAKEEVRTLTATVSELVVVPEGETPTLATVEDPSKLQNQSFFASAKKGDKVLIFTQAKRAILYRPSLGKVVESSSVNIGSDINAEKTESESEPAEQPASQENTQTQPAP